MVGDDTLSEVLCMRRKWWRERKKNRVTVSKSGFHFSLCSFYAFKTCFDLAIIERKSILSKRNVCPLAQRERERENA